MILELIAAALAAGSLGVLLSGWIRQQRRRAAIKRRLEVAIRG